MSHRAGEIKPSNPHNTQGVQKYFGRVRSGSFSAERKLQPKKSAPSSVFAQPERKYTPSSTLLEIRGGINHESPLKMSDNATTGGHLSGQRTLNSNFRFVVAFWAAER